MSRAARPVVSSPSRPRSRWAWTAGRWSGLFVGLALAVAGCGQGLGERCEIDDDCEAGLKCSTNGTCSRGGPTVDAAPTSDAMFVSRPDTGMGLDADGAVATPDASPTDGPMSSIDAPVETVDAAVVDAAGDAS